MNQILVTEKVIVTPEFRRKKKIYKFNFFLSVFLACTLFSCYIYAEYDRNKSEEVSQEILVGLEQEDDTIEGSTTAVSLEDDVLVVKFSDNIIEGSSEAGRTIADLLQSVDDTNQPAKVIETTASDGSTYYTESKLTIPSLDIEYPVLSDTSDELLKKSLNKLWGPDPNEVGNYVIIGHNYKSGKLFGKLSGIKKGDICEVEDLSGRTIKYEVYDKYTIEPTDLQCTSQLTGGKKEITLITCQNSGKKRLVVKATEVE